MAMTVLLSRLNIQFLKGRVNDQTQQRLCQYYDFRKWNSSFLQFEIKESAPILIPGPYQNPLNRADFSVKEIKIPSVGGFVAGKLWQGKDAEIGNSDIPILCMHGWLDNAGTFDNLMPLIMRSSTTALAIDFPGHGLSSHIGPVHYDSQVEGLMSIHSVIRYLRWDKFIIMGHSLGAIVGFVFAGVFPEKVQGFVALENVRPIPRNCKEELRYAVLKLLEVDAKINNLTNKIQLPAYEYEEILQRFYDGRGGSISMEGCKTLLKRGAVHLPNKKFRFAHDIRAAIPTGLWRFAPSQTEEIAVSIKCPVCFIKGEPGGDYEPRENYNHIVDLMRTSSPRVEFHGVTGTHHFHLNDPYPVAPIINQFLESVS